MTKEHRTTLSWIAVALVVFGAALVWKRARATPPRTLTGWQRPVSELTPAQRDFHTRLRAGLRVVEAARSTSKAWPDTGPTTDASWRHRQQRLAINYVADAEGLRWLVLFLEPDPRANEPAPPEDDEHHTLPDGTALHVTVWTQPLTEASSDVVTAFPAAEGWVERVAQ